MSNKQITSLPVLELGVDRIECPSCGWGYRKEHGKVLVGAIYTDDWRGDDARYKLGEVSCDGCFGSYVVKINGGKIYNY